MIIRTTILAALALGALAAPPVQAQSADSGAFFIRLGRDTIAVERYVRTKEQLVGEAVLRTPQTRRYKLTVQFRDDGGVSWYEVQNQPVAGVPNAAPAMRSVVTYVADSARFETWVQTVNRGGRSVPARPDMIPLQLPFYSTYETALMRARKAATDSLTVSMLATSGPYAYFVRFPGNDSVTLSHPQAGILRGRIDAAGRVVDLSGAGTTFKVDVTRAKWADIDAFAARYAKVDAAGKALGPLSPRDTVEAELGAVSFAHVLYGRPSKRGRITFGGIVPWGEVWRTGANEATMIHLTTPVEIGGVQIPQGTYSMWTIPDPKQWTLIINKQTKQWGTSYDETQDLARIAVKSETVPVPVEMFTIAFKPATKTQPVVMTLTWDKTRVVVPIKPLPKTE